VGREAWDSRREALGSGLWALGWLPEGFFSIEGYIKTRSRKLVRKETIKSRIADLGTRIWVEKQLVRKGDHKKRERPAAGDRRGTVSLFIGSSYLSFSTSFYCVGFGRVAFVVVGFVAIFFGGRVYGFSLLVSRESLSFSLTAFDSFLSPSETSPSMAIRSFPFLSLNARLFLLFASSPLLVSASMPRGPFCNCYLVHLAYRLII